MSDTLKPKGRGKGKPRALKFEDMSFYRKAEFYELQQWLALHPKYAEVILSIVSKEHPVAQRIIEYAQTGYAKKYNLCLSDGKFDVRERFKFGPRKDPNCRGEWIRIPYKEEVYRTTTRQLHDLIFVVAGGATPDQNVQDMGPLYHYIVKNYEMIKNDLNHCRELVPNKKDISHIPRPKRQATRTAAYWIPSKRPKVNEKH